MVKEAGIFEREKATLALKESIIRLNPLKVFRNPVIFIVEMGALATVIITIYKLFIGVDYSFDIQVSLWLWFTVIFANFAEALAEIHGKARAESLKKARSEIKARKILEDGSIKTVSSDSLVKGDIICVGEGEVIADDGDIIEGTALVDESTVTGESIPVKRESGGDRSGVTGGTKLVSGEVKIKITVNPGESFLDKMISMVESATREKTPNEKALEILILGLTAVFLVVVLTLPVFSDYVGINTTGTDLIALLVCLMPTTIGALLPAIGIAGMDRLHDHNVIALSGRAVEAAGDVSVVLLDKTGTITVGTRRATEFIPAENSNLIELTEAAYISSLADKTPEGKSIVKLAREILNKNNIEPVTPAESEFLPFSPETCMSGVNFASCEIRKGDTLAIENYVRKNGVAMPSGLVKITEDVARKGDTPLVVANKEKVLGVIRLKDVLKKNIAQRLAHLRTMGIKSIMVTGDNELTAKSISNEAGLDGYIAKALPETKLEVIKQYQAGENQNLVAMIGDGTNDAPALAQADVAIAMSSGTAAAREAANMIDLDSSPSKLLDVVEIGKEILITRGAITTFSISNDMAKYFAIIPALFMAAEPTLSRLNIMDLYPPQSAILSAVIFNAVVIPLLIPLALRGVKYRHYSSIPKMLAINIAIYGFGGLIFPFIGIKLINMVVEFIGLIRT
ncbi:MAG: potassium-transporting ATPase subunit KdpB [Methanobacteriaceae archaeon]|nr:potassium-transporting ATPase subunit KdpB [Methanobacteriaceae archaeon]